MNLDDVVDYLASEADEGLMFTGAQLYVDVAGRVEANVAVGIDGLGRAMTTSTIHRGHCVGKPLTAVAIALLVDRLELSFHDKLGNVIEDVPLHPHLQAVTIDQLLSHSAGLDYIPAAHFGMLPTAANRSELVASTPPRQHYRGIAYSEYSAWHLLGMAIANLDGRSAAEFIEDEVIKPLGLEGAVYFGRPETASELARLAPLVDMRDGRPRPQLFSVSALSLDAREPANGIVCTMEGMGAFYRSLLGILSGDEGLLSQDSLAHLTSPSRPAQWDPVMERECRYGHGFMVSLSEHLFARACSESSFGHSGYLGTMAAFADPEHDLVVGLLTNGVIDSESSVMFRRVVQLEQVYRALGIERRDG